MSGILLLGDDEVIESRALSKGISLSHGERPSIPFDKTLITIPGTRVPFEMMPAAFHLLESWDAAVPLWDYLVTAESAGSPNERASTSSIIRDLRVLLHSVELLFVRSSELGTLLVSEWIRESSSGGDVRLAFLRALYTVKPRLCVLPTSWLPRAGSQSKLVVPSSRSMRPRISSLVSIEIAPGVLVKCHPGDENKVIEMMRQRGVRNGRTR